MTSPADTQSFLSRLYLRPGTWNARRSRNLVWLPKLAKVSPLWKCQVYKQLREFKWCSLQWAFSLVVSSAGLIGNIGQASFVRHVAIEIHVVIFEVPLSVIEGPVNRAAPCVTVNQWNRILHSHISHVGCKFLEA